MLLRSAAAAVLSLVVFAAPAVAQDTTPPTAVLSAPATAQPGAVIPLSGTGSSDAAPGKIISYRWTVGTRPPVVTPDPTFNAPGLPVGRYQITLLVTDDAGNESAPDTKTLTIGDPDPPTAVLTAPATAQPGAVIPLSGTGSSDVGGKIISYRWTVGTRPPVVTPDPTFNAPGLPVGRYQITLLVTDDAGNESAPDTKTLTIGDPDPPTAVLTAPATAEAGATIPLSGTGSSDIGGKIISYRWTVGNRPPVVTPDPTFNAPGLPPGNHVIALLVTDDAGNESATVTRNVLVRDTRAPTARLAAPTTVAPGATIRLSGTQSSDVAPGKIISYRWTVGSRSPVVTRDASFDAPGLAAGTYKLKLVVTDDAGNESEVASKLLTVAVPPEQQGTKITSFSFTSLVAPIDEKRAQIFLGERLALAGRIVSRKAVKLTARFTLASTGKKLGKASVRVPAGGFDRLQITLSRREAKALAGLDKVKLTLDVKTRDLASGRTTKDRKTLVFEIQD